jgi:opacity protein-like surface antigen
MILLRTLLFLGAVAPALGLSMAAHAQEDGVTFSPVQGERSSLWSWVGRGYVGLNLGRSRYSVPCGSIALLCDSTDRSARFYTGSMIGNFWGVEVGYLNSGTIARAGGQTRAQGFNLSLVGKAPLGHSFKVFGRFGSTYGQTDASFLAAGGIGAGTERGFGLSYGGGVSYDFTPRLSATLEWESSDFRFAGLGRDPVRSANLGLQYRY